MFYACLILPSPPFFASPACYVDPTVRLAFDLRVIRVLSERTTYGALSILYGDLRVPRHLLQVVGHFGSLQEATLSEHTIGVISKCIGPGGVPG
jgi:hypothetical protein